jgi:hypothetical protein
MSVTDNASPSPLDWSGLYTTEPRHSRGLIRADGRDLQPRKLSCELQASKELVACTVDWDRTFKGAVMNVEARRTLSLSSRMCSVAAALALSLFLPGIVLAQAPDQPVNFTAIVQGNRVSFSWQPPVSVSQLLLGYQLEARTAPGTTAVTLQVGNTNVYLVDAPNGVYYVRVRALLAGGPAAVASTEVPVIVPSLPLAPEALISSVERFTVSLRWQLARGSSAVTGWLLQAGSAPGLSDLGTVPLPAAARSLVVPAPQGTYYVRLIALGVSGAGPPSNEVQVITGPQVCDVPSVPTVLFAYGGEGGVRFRWSEPTGGLPTAYTLVAGTAPGSSNAGTYSLPPATVLGTAAPPGTYYVRVAAANPCGASPLSNEVSVMVSPASGASLVGTWSGTVSNYTKPYPYPPITSFELTLNNEPTPTSTTLSGLWVDNKGCRTESIVGGISGLPVIAIESLVCNDSGDFVLTVQSNNGAVAEGRCNSGPNCTFRMTRR